MKLLINLIGFISIYLNKNIKEKFIFYFTIILFSLSGYSVAMPEIGIGQIQFSNPNNRAIEALLLNAKAHIDVTGLTARVSLKQTYKNTSNEWVEGIYLLPLPENAAIDSLRIKTEEGVIEGIITEKQQAKKIYQQAKREGRKAAIVNSERPNLFTTKVANIAPNSEVNIEVSYLQPIYFDNNIFSISLPSTLTPRYIPKKYNSAEAELDNTHLVSTSGWASLKNISPAQNYYLADSNQINITATIHSGLPLSTIYSSSHKITWSKDKGNYQVALEKTVVPMNRDFILSWETNLETIPVAAIFSETYKQDNYLNLMVIPPQKISINEILPREMVFVIDSSGSMKGKSMVQAKASLNKALELLSPQDKFNIIEFDNTTNPLYSQSQMANSQNISHAKQFVNNIHADGGTEIRQALELSLANKSNENYLKQIIFLTDGSIGNEQEILQIIKSRLGKARLFTIAIGSAPNTFFMRKSAKYGRGTFTNIANMHDIEKHISLLFSKLRNPVLRDISIHWDNGKEVEFYPNPLPDLYLGEPLLVYAKISNSKNNDISKNISNKIIIKGKLRNESWSRTVTYNTNSHINGISKIWARNKIENLMDQSVLGLGEIEIKEKVLPLALQYNLVSKYTSLVAVEKHISRVNENSIKMHRIKNLMPEGSTMQVPYPGTATNAELFRYFGLLLLLLAIAIYSKAKKLHIK